MLARGAVRRHGAVVVRTHENGLGYARLGIIASRKALPRAVDRNRARRRVREAFRRVCQRLPAVDIVVQFGVRSKGEGPLTWTGATLLFASLAK